MRIISNRTLLLIMVSAGLTGGITAYDRPPQATCPETIKVFAAAGTSAAMQRIAALYSQQNGVQVQLNLASSAVLARQIELDADWDVFISANKQWMDYVVEHKSLKAETVVKLLRDRLALVVPVDADNRTFAPDNPSFAQNFKGHLAIGNPASVPAGIYAKQALEKLGWWQYLDSKTVPAVDVAAALRYVETGQCQAGIVYLSGVKKSSKVKILYVFDESLHNSIYFLAVADAASEQGRLFLQFLSTSAGAADIFTDCGFQPVAKK